MNRLTKLLFVAAVTGFIPAAGAHAALVTFSGAYDVGQAAIPQTYQPLQNQYTGPDGTADGADIDVTVTWNSAFVSNPQANGGVYDHTTGNVPNRQGVVMFDGGNPSFGMTFDQPVTIPDFFYANFNGTCLAPGGVKKAGVSGETCERTANIAPPASADQPKSGVSEP